MIAASIIQSKEQTTMSKNNNLCSLVFSGILFIATAFFGATVNAANSDMAIKSYIIVAHPQTDMTTLGQLIARTEKNYGAVKQHQFKHALRGFSARIPTALIDRIQRENPEISYIEPNARISVAPPRSIKVTAKAGPAIQTTPWGVFRVGGGVNGTGRHAWVIDTGIDANHEDLNVGVGANFVLKGRNSTSDGNGHGTHVAGTIAALDNGIGVIGVAAGATVHPVRVLDNNGSGTIDSVIAGIDYVMQNADPLRGDVANLSLGALGHFQSLHELPVTMLPMPTSLSRPILNITMLLPFLLPTVVMCLPVSLIMAIHLWM
jgi:subtilisin family serine protease